MSRMEIKCRLAGAAIDLENFELKSKLRDMSDEELLETLESLSQGGDLNFHRMTDAELEMVVNGSPKLRRQILDKHKRRL